QIYKPVILVVTAYADQKFKKVDPDIVAGVLRKPFEVADLGALVRLCVNGFQSALQMAGARDGMSGLAGETMLVPADEGNRPSSN
ncbi:MAG TPA: hypothetical protein VF698_08865, partial [Thermoanaerobaculia bacterium]